MNLIHALQDDRNPRSAAAHFRRARARRILDLISAVAAAHGRCRILDLGGRAAYWRNHFDEAQLAGAGVHVTLVNTEGLAEADPLFTSVEGDACALPQYADDAFDLVHSNSVVEHVGDWARMEAFAAETRRLAPAYYVQTPYFWFPVEPHFSAPFFHWRSEQARMHSLMRRRHGWFERSRDVGEAMRAVQHARLLDRAQMRFLFPDAELHAERVLGLTKSLIAVRSNRVAKANGHG